MEKEIWTPSSDIPDGKCTICRIEIQGHGNNPSPVKEEGKCCDTCNSLIVLPHRLRAAGMSEEEIQSYLATILDREKVKEGHIFEWNGKKVRQRGYDPRDYYQYTDPKYQWSYKK